MDTYFFLQQLHSSGFVLFFQPRILCYGSDDSQHIRHETFVVFLLNNLWNGRPQH